MLNSIDIVPELKKGSTHALHAVHDLYYSSLRSFAGGLLEDIPAAEDIVTEVFVTLWRKQQDFETLQNIKAFLYISTRNACINYVKKAQRDSVMKTGLSKYQSIDHEEFVLNEMIRAEVMQQIYAAIEALRPRPDTPAALRWAPEIPIDYLDVGGIRLRFIKTGAGPTIVLLHTLRTQLDLFETLIPRQLEIIYEINRRFLDDVRRTYPGDESRVQRVSLIEEGPTPRVRMAHLAVVGSHSTNGVAQIHSDLLRTRVLRDFAELFPERFNNKTNGVTPRRWLQQANPPLSQLITEAIGEGWVTDLSRLRALLPLAQDAGFRQQFRDAKRAAKVAFAGWLKGAHNEVVDPDTIFDSQIKRIHEYKRQLLNVLHVIVLYNRLRRNPNHSMNPHTFFFAGKAAPAYHFAKLVIKLITQVAATINRDAAVRGRLKVLFLPEYNVSLAERLIPASDVSEQISTAGYEASGTGNMKFMMNGALTIGTRDGATIEMAQEAGEENFFLFGLTAQQVADGSGWYDPHWHYANEPETREALDLIFSDHFSPDDRGVFGPIRRALLDYGDHYRHLADLSDYSRAHRELDTCYSDAATWTRKAIFNVACSGRFSSDRTIKEYADEIWNLKTSQVS